MVFIGVIGGSEVSADIARRAEEVGQEIARRGGTLVCGGLGGVMEAAYRGAFKAGGLTIGILPGNNRAEANPYVMIPVVTGIGYARNVASSKHLRLLLPWMVLTHPFRNRFCPPGRYTGHRAGHVGNKH